MRAYTPTSRSLLLIRVSVVAMHVLKSACRPRHWMFKIDVIAGPKLYITRVGSHPVCPVFQERSYRNSKMKRRFNLCSCR